jgi:hypothetical protein
MRRTVVVAMVFLAVGFLAGRLCHQAPVSAEGQGGGTPSGNGDVNGDSSLNITDPIYLLQHLFQGGPPPVPIITKAAGLPATGQTKCYSRFAPWQEIDCASTDYPGQDGFYQAGYPIDGCFVDNRDGTVTDNCTGLMWQKDTADVNGDGAIDPDWPGTDRLGWQNALNYCENLSFAGYDDWRLPNVRELQSIVTYGRWDPAIDPVFGAVSDGYWSSSSIAGSELEFPGADDSKFYAWYVHFYGGHVWVDGGAVSLTFVRAVRGGL